jgi:hypothetical protein
MVPWLVDARDACLHAVKHFTCTRALAANARAATGWAALILCCVSVMPRRFPAPWYAEVTPNCFIVRAAISGEVALAWWRRWLDTNLNELTGRALIGIASGRGSRRGRWS